MMRAQDYAHTGAATLYHFALVSISSRLLPCSGKHNAVRNPGDDYQYVQVAFHIPIDAEFPARPGGTDTLPG